MTPPPLPPPLPVPPPLPAPAKRPGARRWLWGILGLVVVLRYGVFRGYYAEYQREKQEEERIARRAGEPRDARQGPRPGQRPGGPPGGNRGREPLVVRPAATEVPPDFPRLRITIDAGDVRVLEGYRWNGWMGPGMERPKVPVVVSDGHATFSNVWLHPKGSAGSFRRFDDKPALTLDFSKASPAREFLGYRKLSLNNSAQDPSYLAEILSRELFEAAGIPVPKASHATALVNGRDLGVFVMTEGWGISFLRRHFADVGGNLYDGGFCKDIDAGLEVNSGDEPDDRSDLAALAEAAESDPDGRMERVGKVLDLDRFFRMAAIEVLLCHWDGYTMNRNNYRIFHDRATGRMVFMPHGMDQMFGIRRSSPSAPILPRWRGMIARDVLELPDGHARYLHELSVLHTQLVLADRLTRRVAELTARLRPTLAAYGPDFVARQETAAHRLSERIVARSASVDRQLALLATGGEPAAQRPSTGDETRAERIRRSAAETAPPP